MTRPNRATLERHAFRLAPDAMFVIGRDGIIAHVNDAAEGLTGYLKEELIGMPVGQLVPSDVRARHVEHMRAYQELPWHRPMLLRTNLGLAMKGGFVRPVQIELSQIDSGDSSYVIASVRDDTALRELRANLETSEALFRGLFEFSPIPYVIVTVPDGRIKRYNHAAAALFGACREDLAGATLSEVFRVPDGASSPTAHVIERIRDGRSLIGIEIPITVCDGSGTRIVSIFARPIDAGMDGGGALCHVGLLDVTPATVEEGVGVSRPEMEGFKLPCICAWCRRMRDDDLGGWVTIETYMTRRIPAGVSHGICPTCQSNIYE